jgi:hypothetical protein
MIDKSKIKELLRINEAGYLHHRESQILEFKEQFNFAGLAEYLKDFAAFANNKGGYLIFGVKDSPRRIPNGLSSKSLIQFEKIDPEKISGFLNEIFSGHITWDYDLIELDKKNFGVFIVEKAFIKPIIAKKDDGKDQTIKNGEIYFRYGGRTQKIEYSELEAIINKRIEQTNKNWMDLLSKIGNIGPHNAAIYDLENSILEKDDAKILVVDDDLANKLKFIKEGEFVEKSGAPTLKLVGDVLPIDKVEIVKKIKENLLKEFPLTATELCDRVKQKVPSCTTQDVWNAIKENDVKSDSKYSVYNFRNKRHEDLFSETGELPNGTPSIYKLAAVDYLTTLIKNEKLKNAARYDE